MRQPRPQRKLIWTLARLGFLLFLFLVMLRWFEQKQVYHPTRILTDNPGAIERSWDDVSFFAQDGVQLHGWFIPASTNSVRKEWVVLFCHGNGGNISHRLDSYEALLTEGLNVFVFDYRGYGKSEGVPSEHGTYLDAEAAYQWVIKKGFAAEQIIVLGESLGGGIGSELAMRQPIAGLILQSSFTSIPAIGAELFPWLPVRLLAKIKYDTASKLPLLKAPLLIMHSRADTLIGYHHAEANFAVAKDPKMIWELDGDHNDTLLVDEGKFRSGINAFLQKLQKPKL